MSVIQASERARVERDAHGRVDTVIGCIDTGRAELNIVVSGSDIDLSVASRLEEEELLVAAVNAVSGCQAHAYIVLDGVHADGLLQLLQQAVEVRARGLADQ